MKDKTGAPEYNKPQPQNDLENRSMFIPLGSISGSQISDIAPFLDDTAGGTDAETTKAPTSNVIYDHAVASSGVHGAGTSTIATTANIASHSALTTGVHGVGTSLVASVKDIADHAGLTATHGVAGTIAAKSDIATDTNLSAAAQSTIIAKPTWIVASSSTVTGTALTDITGWTFVCATGSTYKFEAYISNNCSHTTGVAYGIGLAVTSCIVEAQIHGISVAGTGQAIMLAATGTKSAFFNKIAATGAVYFTGVVKTAGTGGTLSLQHCAGSAAATVTVRTNSVWEIIKIA